MMAKPIQDLVQPHLVDIHTYDPVDPPEVLAKRAGVPEESIVKLNGNENPYGGSPKVAEALAKAQVHIYPDPLQRSARAALSAHTGFDESHIIAGAGSDELIDLLLRLLSLAGRHGAGLRPHLRHVRLLRQGGGRQDTARPPRWLVRHRRPQPSRRPSTSAPRSCSSARRTTLPATSSPRPNVRELLEAGPVVVVDEAYHEFARETLAGLVPEYDNLVVLRTLSKWAGPRGPAHRLRLHERLARGPHHRHQASIQHQRRGGGGASRVAGGLRGTAWVTWTASSPSRSGSSPSSRSSPA